MKTAYVNLWELITTIGNNPDLPNYDKCNELQILNAQKPSFASELALTVTENGVWVVDVFDHEDRNGTCITLTIEPSGYLTVKRTKSTADMVEIRSMSF